VSNNLGLPAAPVSRGPGPLDGVVVLDFSRVLSGPHCARALADLGADVIKIEPPEGDMTRYAQPRVNSLATYYVQQNVGKRVISLDLKKPEAVSLLRRLAERADVVLENFRPGVMKRSGLDYESLSAINPRLVYASISGFGQTGPWKDRRAYAGVIQAESGFTRSQVEAQRRRRPDFPYVTDEHSHGDVYTSLEAAIAICAALYRRSITGRGQHIDISMLDTLLSVNEHLQSDLYDGPMPAGQVRSYQPGDYAILTVGNGRSVIVTGHAAEDGNFANFSAAMGRPNLATEDPRFATVTSRLEHLQELYDELQAWAITFPNGDEIEKVFEQHGLAMGNVRTTREVASSDWSRERGSVLGVTDRGEGEILVPNAPWRFSDADAGVRGVPKYRGEDNRSVLHDLLGLDDDELTRLENDGVLLSRVPGPSKK
jgi:crotonobetainyl-CoA:carnitine CoA-transferase CaiB-like acyl-CoA transferase